MALVEPRGWPDMARARALPPWPDQGVTDGADASHQPSTVFDQPAGLAIRLWRDGGAEDEEFAAVPPFDGHPPEATDAA